MIISVVVDVVNEEKLKTILEQHSISIIDVHVVNFDDYGTLDPDVLRHILKAEE